MAVPQSGGNIPLPIYRWMLEWGHCEGRDIPVRTVRSQYRRCPIPRSPLPRRRALMRSQPPGKSGLSDRVRRAVTSK